jgi:hypothetical protein
VNAGRLISVNLEINLKVDVYRNLHKDCFSVRGRESHNRGKVICHLDELFVADVEFAVQRAGQKKVRETRKKNVHAFVRGTMVPLKSYIINEILRDLTPCELIEVTYNPYKTDRFSMVDDGTLVDHADYVILKDKKIYAMRPRLGV